MGISGGMLVIEHVWSGAPPVQAARHLGSCAMSRPSMSSEAFGRPARLGSNTARSRTDGGARANASNEPLACFKSGSKPPCAEPVVGGRKREQTTVFPLQQMLQANAPGLWVRSWMLKAGDPRRGASAIHARRSIDRDVRDEKEWPAKP